MTEDLSKTKGGAIHMRKFTIFFLVFFLCLLSSYLIWLNYNSRPVLVESVLPYNKKDKIQKVPQSILIFGDMMLDRSVAERMDNFGLDYPFREIRDILWQSKIVVANLEGVFTDNKSVARKDSSKLQFTFDKKLAPIFKEFNFSILSQANNHTNDFGREGALESYKFLEENSISSFGDFFNEHDNVAFGEINNKKIVFIGFNEFSYINENKILDLIKKYDDGYKVIVMPHWGIEYKDVSNANQQKLAHDFIDAGADIVIGSHPHVVQEIEIYNNKLIFYSLGNFVFDQDFSKKTTEGLGVKVIFGDKNTRISLIPFNILKSQVHLKDKNDREDFFKDLSNRSHESIQGNILKGEIELKN